MTIFVVVAAMLLIGGCSSYIQQAEAKCAEQGHSPGTDAHAQCVEAEVQKQRLVMGL